MEATDVNRINRGKRTGISPEMALRLSKALGTSPEFWYGMQVNFDLWQAKKKFRGKVRPIVQGPISAA